MNQDEMMIARDVRRQLERRPIDVTMAIVTVSRGVVSIGGQVRGLRTDPTVDVQHEMETFRRSAPRYMREIKDIIFECRVIPNPKRQKPDDHAAGGDHTRK